jgi:hypothetical protein
MIRWWEGTILWFLFVMENYEKWQKGMKLENKNNGKWHVFLVMGMMIFYVGNRLKLDWVKFRFCDEMEVSWLWSNKKKELKINDKWI